MSPITGRLRAAASTGTIAAIVLGSLIAASPANAATPAIAPALTPAIVSSATITALPLTSTAKTYTVKSGDSLWAIGLRNNVPLNTLFSLNNLNGASIIHPGQVIKLSAASAAKKPTPAVTVKITPKAPTAQSSGTTALTHKVVAGDTMGALAVKYKVKLSSLLSWNSLKMTSIIYVGQTVKVSDPATAKAPATKPTTPAPTAPKPPVATNSAANAPVKATTHKVVAGDTMGAIAAKYGITLPSALAWNGLQMNSVIYVGQTIKLTGGAANTATPAPAPTAPNNTGGVLTKSSTVAQVKAAVTSTAKSMGVDPALALAIAEQESGFRVVATSWVGAKGTMQVMPANEEWVSGLVGRKLSLDNPDDNIVAGVAMLRLLVKTSPSLDIAIASYYQGQHGVMTRGMFEDTKVYLAQVKARMAKFR